MIGAELSRVLQRLLLPVQWQKGESKYQNNKPGSSLSMHQNGKNVAVQMEQQNLNSSILVAKFEWQKHAQELRFWDRNSSSAPQQNST